MSGRREKRNWFIRRSPLAAASRAGLGDQQPPVAASHSLTVSLPVAAPRGSNSSRVLEVEPGFGKPVGDLPVGEAEAQMRMLVAQEFQRVRREIDDDQPAARPQQPRRLADRHAPARRDSAAPGAWSRGRRRRARPAARRCRPAAPAHCATPALSRLARATASISRDMSMPTPRR